MLSCLGFSRRSDDAEHEPLLPRYNDDTALQTRLHEKLHTYQMLRALTQGYMPSNEQTIVHLRALLSADVLNPDSQDLSDSGRSLVRTIRLWLQQSISLLEHKNSKDQIQDFFWYLLKARLHVDTADLGARVTQAKVKAESAAAYQSLRTVGSLLLTNSDFRVFLSDLETVSKEVFRDSAFSIAEASKEAGKKLDPSDAEQQALVEQDDSQKAPTQEELGAEVNNITGILSKGASDVAHDAESSIAQHAAGAERDALTHRLKQAVLHLRKRPDYADSVSTLSLLLRKLLLTYSHAAVEAADTLENDFDTNPEADQALHNFWLLVTSIGDSSEWRKVEDSFKNVVEAGKNDPNFDELVEHLSSLVQDMLANPEFFDDIDTRVTELRDKYRNLSSKSSTKEELETMLSHLHKALQSVLRDEDIDKLKRTTWRIAQILSPSGNYTNGELLGDSVNVFVPLIIQAIQFFPIPRLEVSTPGIDILLENLILEPGKTINHSSFLPFKLNISTQNDVEVRKARFGTTSTVQSLVSVKISGMSIAADDLGYWLRLHSGLLRMVDEGIAGFHLDQRGLDITLDLEIGKDRLEKIVSLRNVNVKIHHLNYSLSKSKFACLAWLLKPLIRPIVRKALELKIAAAIGDGLHTLNRELLYARERLRATRIANPNDLWTFVKAVAARLVPAADPDIETRVGVKPGAGVFHGRYAPGSLVKLWEEEGRTAEQRVYEYERDGWRNGIFDVIATRP